MADVRFQELLEILKKYSWMERDQEFTLVSGRKSRFYIDARATTLRPDGARLVGELIYSLLADTGVSAVGGMATAAIPMVTAVAMASAGKPHPLPAFYVREETKEHGTQKRIEGAFPSQRGASVAMLEDTITTGGSLLRAIQAVEEEGAKVAQVVVLVDRHEGGCERLRAVGYQVVTLFDMDAAGQLQVVLAPA